MQRDREQRGFRVGVFGATGLVGRELIALLESRRFPIDSLRIFASSRSVGTPLEHGDTSRRLRLEDSERADLGSIDLAFLATGAEASRRLAPILLEAGATVIDCSSAFRHEPDVPLVVPEINGQLLEREPAPRLIACPNCSTAIALMAVEPIRRAAGIVRMTLCTYQAVSGAGAAALAELESQVASHAVGAPITPRHFASPCLFNVFSHESPVDLHGENQEEAKIRSESRRIWDDPDLAVAATCVRVPTLRAHAEAINLTLERSLSVEEARALLAETPGVELFDRVPGTRAPEPCDAEGRDEVLVGRVRADLSQPPGRGLWLFAVADQLRKGAALNAVQIAEILGRSAAAVTPAASANNA